MMLYFHMVEEGFWHFMPSVNDMYLMYYHHSNYHVEAIMERKILKSLVSKETVVLCQ